MPSPSEHRPGHQWMLSAPLYGLPPQRVDAEKGVIYGFAVVTEGEAKGHGVHLDAEFVQEVVKRGNEKAHGLKSRFGHPNMSSTALGTFLGRVKNLRSEPSPQGLVARGDLYLSTTARETPQGDLYGYVLSLADNDAAAFGSSIVFEPGQLYRRDAAGNKVILQSGDEPEPDDRVFVELGELHADDLVDDPAANPSGLFGSAWADETWAGQVTQFLDLHPEIFDLIERHPDAVRGFLARYRSYLARKGKTMADQIEAAVGAAEQKLAGQESTVAAEAAPEPETAAPPAEAPAPAENPGKRFLEAFGQQGAVWFVEGKSFDEATQLHVADLRGQLAAKDKALADAKAAHAEELKAKDAEIAALKQRLEAASAAGFGNPPVAQRATEEAAAEDEEFTKLLEAFDGDEKRAKAALARRQKARAAKSGA